jgi:integrase
VRPRNWQPRRYVTGFPPDAVADTTRRTMPKLRPGQVPSLRRHKPSGRAVVTLSGKDHYLGPWPPEARNPPPEVVNVYNRLVAEWLAGSRQVPLPTAGGPGDRRSLITVGELIIRFWRHAEGHYRRPEGTPSGELRNMRDALRPLRRLYETLPAAEFLPLKLKAVRLSMIDQGLSRPVINSRVGRIVRVFKWAVAEELVPVSTYQALKTVTGLQRGRTAAPEPEPVQPVADEDVRAVLPHVLPEVAAMIELQRLTGMRPGEVCQLRPCDLDRSGQVWIYRPGSHKTAHRGRERVVPVGPRAQAVLAPWVVRPGLGDADFVFSPRRAMAALRVRIRAARKTKVQPSQQGRAKQRPKKLPGERYTPLSYAHAIARACERAGVPRWSPHRLRHAAATEIRRRYGIEAAQVVLGHSRANVTEVYAERDLALAAKVAIEIG